VSAAIAIQLESYEDVFTAIDQWLRSNAAYREVKLRPTALGITCALYQGGNPVATATGKHADEAIANALELAP